jgi:hypothetical protein
MKLVSLYRQYKFVFTELVKRDFKKKYKRSVLGVFWSMLAPLFTLLVINFVFGHFFGRNQEYYTIDLFSGWLIFQYYNEATNGGKIFYPDANSTLRVTYGKVKGYKPADAIYYTPVSSLTGIIEKDNPEIYDYNIPQRLRDLYAAKDFGQWEYDGSVPVAFIATNHTSGGNSGSPVLDAEGNLIGVNFDRVWEGTMSDVVYDPVVCRNIALDIRYALFIIDKLAGATHLLDEMEILK